MLRESASAFAYDLDLAAVADPSIPIGIPGGTELMAFVDAVIGGGDVSRAHAAVLDALGPEALFDAAAVIGNFQMMNRVAEVSGITVPPQAIDREAGTIEVLGLGRLLGS